MTGWRYSINYGPEGEENYAMVYDAEGDLVGNLRTHHAMAVVAAANASNSSALEANDRALAEARAEIGGLRETIREHGVWDFPRDLQNLTVKLESTERQRDEALEALRECEEYFDNRADADCDQDGFIPNKEMRLLSVVRTALSQNIGKNVAEGEA